MLSPVERVRSLVRLCALLGGDEERPEHRVPSWESVVDLAQEHLVDGALCVVLHRSGQIDDLSPLLARALLWARRRASVAEAGFRRQLGEAITALNRIDIVPLVLKGGAFVLDGTFPVGFRSMHDIDVLVGRKEMSRALAGLGAIGYQLKPNPNMDSAHERVLVRPDVPGPLDLHFELGERPVSAVLSTGEAFASAADRTRDGARWQRLSPTHEILYSILHSQLQDLNYAIAGVPIRQLHTYVALARHHGDRVDWAHVARTLAEHRLGRMQAGHSELARRLFGFVTPAVPGTTAPSLHYIRCLSTFAISELADIQRNLRYALDADYLRYLYGSANTFCLRLRHGRNLLRKRGFGVIRESMVRRAR